MLRRALIYQLILAVAVGPLLCCCSAGKLLANSPPLSGTPASSHSHGPTERVSHSCCSHKHQPANPGQNPAPSKKSDPSKPGHPADKCPCKDGGGEPQATQADSALTGVSTFLRTLTLDPVAPFISPTIGETVASCVGGRDGRRCPPHHSLTTAELLYAHHNLRC